MQRVWTGIARVLSLPRLAGSWSFRWHFHLALGWYALSPLEGAISTKGESCCLCRAADSGSRFLVMIPCLDIVSFFLESGDRFALRLAQMLPK